MEAGCGEREAYEAGCHVAVMRDVDRIMDRYYGRRGDTSGRFYGVITASGRDAYETVCRRSRELTTQHLSRFAPDVLARLREMGSNGRNE